MASNRFTTFASRASFFLLAVALLAGPSLAQSGRCRISGVVVSESYTQSLPGATIELVGDPENERIKSVTLTATTDERGLYAINEIPYGEYTLRVSAPEHNVYEIPISMVPDTLTQLHVLLHKV